MFSGGRDLYEFVLFGDYVLTAKSFWVYSRGARIGTGDVWRPR
jgi:hypothetical protein